MKAGALAKTMSVATLLSLWDRTLVWLNEYLALDVLPRTRATVPEEPPVADMTPLPGAGLPAAVAERRAANSLQWHASQLPSRGGIPNFAVGERPAEGLEVKRILNANDFATAYLAHHEHWNMDLVVKVPHPFLVNIASALRQVVTRAEQWVAIGLHPNIASCYYLHSLNGVPLRISEYVEGSNLRDWIRAGHGADLRAALDLAIQLCHGLEHAHSRGITHGHLVPENVLLTVQRSPKLTDFGTRAAVRGAASPDAASDADGGLRVILWRLMCMAPYVAPERWRNPLVVDVQADVFSLGVCLYEMFAGCLPYVTTSPPLREPIDAATRPELPDKLCALLRRCVGWRPEERPTSIEAIRVGLCAIYEEQFGAARVSERESSEADEWNNKAVSYFCLGQESEADVAWEHALEADAGHLDTLFNRGLARWRRGAITDEQLIQELESVPLDREDRWRARYLLALIQEERSDIDAAIALLEQADRDRPGNASVHATLGRLRSGPLRAALGRRIFDDHTGYVSAVCLSADGRLGLSASHDGAAILWDVRTGSRLQVFEGHAAPVSCAYLSNDGHWAVTGSDDHTLRLWDVDTGECQRVFEGHAGRIAAASMSQDGRRLLWAGNFVSQQVEGATVQLWDAQSGRALRTLRGHTSAVKAVFLSSDGRWALTGSDDMTARLWDATTGDSRQVFEGHRHFVSAVCFGPGETAVLSGSWDGTMRLWDVQSGRCTRTFEGHRGLITSVGLSSDGSWALSGSWDCTVRFWEVATGRCLRTLQGHTSLVTGVAISADGRRGLSGGWDRTVRLWELPADKDRGPRLLRSGEGGLEESPNG